MAAVVLTELQRIPTSGARAVEPFTVDGLQLLAIPQLAVDVPGRPAEMNGGDSDTDLLLMRRDGARYVAHSTLPGPGGEDAEFFVVRDRAFLAVASIRSGSGPYRYLTESRIFEWTGSGFAPFQSIETFAAKQWRHWTIGGRHLLGLAQGVALPHVPGPNRDSVIYEWDGASFVELQTVPSRWAYNWHPLSIDGVHLLAHADHVLGSRLLRWDGERYREHQPLLSRAGRAFADFEGDGVRHLLVAGLADPPLLLRWDGDRFQPHQRLEGLGARELTVLRVGGRLFVVRVNFILGTPADPRPSLTSQVYEWDGGQLRLATTFPTTGGTDVAAVTGPDGPQLIVSNGLSADVRFAAHTTLYALTVDGSRP